MSKCVHHVGNVLIKSYLISTADHLTHSNSSFHFEFHKKKSISAMLCFFDSMHNPFCNALPEWVDYPLIFALNVWLCFGIQRLRTHLRAEALHVLVWFGLCTKYSM